MFDFRSKHELGLFRDQSQRRPPHPVSHLAPPRRPEELYPFRQRLRVLWPRILPRSRKLRHSGQSDPLPVFGGLQGRVLRRGRNRTKPRLHRPGCPRPRRSADGGCSGFREKVVTVTMTVLEGGGCVEAEMFHLVWTGDRGRPSEPDPRRRKPWWPTWACRVNSTIQTPRWDARYCLNQLEIWKPVYSWNWLFVVSMFVLQNHLVLAPPFFIFS